MRYPLISAFMLTVALPIGCRSSLDIPNPSMSGEPGVLQQAWEASGAFEPSDWGPCRDYDDEQVANHGITEIGIERSSCYGFCPTYTLILRSDGTVSYTGQANVEKVGKHTGRIDLATFDFLARLAVDIGFFNTFNEFYACGVTDNETVYVSIVRDGKRKTIKHYAPDRDGPPRLEWFEATIDLASESIEWD